MEHMRKHNAVISEELLKNMERMGKMNVVSIGEQKQNRGSINNRNIRFHLWNSTRVTVH